MPISPRQVAEWDKRGIVYCAREKSNNRNYSIVDLAWIQIIHDFQNYTYSKIESTSEKLRPLVENNFLELCLLRDFSAITRPVAVLEKGDAVRLYRTNKQLNIREVEDYLIVIPIVKIMHDTILKIGMALGVSSIVVHTELHYKRVFQFHGKQICFSDDISSVYNMLNLSHIIRNMNPEVVDIFNNIIRT